jgi:hypothetical protein
MRDDDAFLIASIKREGRGRVNHNPAILQH